MAEDVDLWGVLDEAERTVEQWEGWRREIEVDLWSDRLQNGEPGTAG